jgi:hypothetical protein
MKNEAGPPHYIFQQGWHGEYIGIEWGSDLTAATHGGYYDDNYDCDCDYHYLYD